MKIYWPYHTLIVFILFLFSCENEESLIGNSFLNQGEYVLETYLGDVIIASNPEIDDSVSASSSTSLLGSYLDPFFGQTDASFSFQIQLPANNMSFNAQSIENIYLNIPYIDFYSKEGVDPNKLDFVINVSELNENIVDVSDANGNETDFSANFITSITKNLADIQNLNSLQLNLKEANFGFDEILNLNENELVDNETFLEAFNGFKIEIEPINSIDGGIMYLASTSDSAFLHIEYINTEGGVDTINFEIGSQKRLNYFKHDYVNTSVLENNTLIPLQSMGGIYSNIEITGLENLKNEHYIAVNDAELSISIHNNNDEFPAPQALMLVYEGDNITDYTGGYIDSLNTEYKFDLTNFIQHIITEDDYPVFKLYPNLNNSNADRVILNNNDDNPVKLDLLLIKEQD